tara:strand:+ start:316 stop:795 length:480 start_codon:yes stop_codon:yes gene_type:complete
MTQRLIFVFLLILATSCQFFETEKVTSEKIFQEEIEAIDWKEVDRYPSFSNCENTLEKPEQKECFISTISTHLYKSINHEDIVAVREVYDTVKINFEISSNGQLQILEIRMDTLLKKEFPRLENWIKQSIDSLQPIAPAYKRGVPVKTQFTLPVIIKTN